MNVIYNEDAREMTLLEDQSIDLVITSPPYYNLVDYKNPLQIGLNETYEEYLSSLNKVWHRCISGLKDKGTICINICNSLELARKNGNQYFDLRHDIQEFFLRENFYVFGEIIWNIFNANYEKQQVDRFREIYPNDKTIFLHNYEYILIFKKKETFLKNSNGFSDVELVNCVWNIPWDYRTQPPAYSHIIVEKLIDELSQMGDCILDPFMGQATTAITAFKKNRRFISYEVNPDIYEKGRVKLKKIGAL